MWPMWAFAYYIRTNHDPCLVSPGPADRLQLRADDGAWISGGRLRYPPRMRASRLRSRVFVVDCDRGGGDGAGRVAALRDSRRLADLPCGSQDDDLFRVWICILRRDDRWTARRVPGFAVVPNRVRGDYRHVCPRTRDRAGNRQNGMPACWRWRLG